jgi:alpha-L-fucosidase
MIISVDVHRPIPAADCRKTFRITVRGSSMADKYEATWESLDSHDVPEWYHDAKLGIFIHWGVYSVPAWAPTDEDITEAVGSEFKDSPYAEWYPYFMYEDGSKTKAYHEETYGAEVEYDEFIEDWHAENWDPDAWAEFFDDIGAGYVVLTGEHCDGFPLWDSHYMRYNAAEMGPERDLVADLSESVRDRGLRFAASYHANYNWYQPGFEGRWGHPDYEGGAVRDRGAQPGPEYVEFMNAKHREIIRKYEPDLLWFDVPMADSDYLNAKDLLADYYNTAAEEWDKDVAVNDRAGTDAIGPTVNPDRRDNDEYHGDFITPEYVTLDEISEQKWELCRGVGLSFGYNAAEGPDEHLSAEELIHMFVDVVSKNGNLLINVGPMADGTIPDLQTEPLEALGEWLDVTGEAIFGTTYWVTSQDDAAEVEVRYTWKDGTLYATAFDWPGDRLSLDLGASVDPDDVTRVAALGGDDVDHEAVDGRLRLALAETPPTEHAATLRIEGLAYPRT